VPTAVKKQKVTVLERRENIRLEPVANFRKQSEFNNASKPKKASKHKGQESGESRETIDNQESVEDQETIHNHVQGQEGIKCQLFDALETSSANGKVFGTHFDST